MYTTNLQFYNGILISEKIILFNNNMKLLQEKLAKYDAPQKAMAAGIYPYFRMIESDQDTEVMISGKKS